MVESLPQFILQCFKLVHDGYDNRPISIFSILLSYISILHGFTNFNLFKLYENKDFPALKLITFALFYSLQNIILIMGILSCLFFTSYMAFDYKYSNMINSYNSSKSNGYEPTTTYEQIVNTTTRSESSSNDLDLTIYAFVYVPLVLFWGFFSSVFVMFVVFIQFISNQYPFLFFVENQLKGNVTTEKLLKICNNSAITLNVFSSVVFVFSLYPTFVLHDICTEYGECEFFFSSYSCKQYSERLERYRIFFLFCSILGAIGLVVGIVEFFSLEVRKFIVRHAYVVEDQNEPEIKIERNVEVSSNNRFFKRICLSLGIGRFVSLIVKCIPLCVRKFVIRHACNVETDLENIERTEQDMVENTVEGIIRLEAFLFPYSIYEIERKNEHDMAENIVEVASNGESGTRMAIEGPNGNGTVVVDIHADQESLGQGDGTTDAPQQAGRDESEDHESDDIDPEQVKLLVK